MKLLSCILALASLFVSGCDYIYGVSRGAYTHTLPDLPAVKARIESYPEVKKVKYWEAEGSRPITFTGIKKADEVYQGIVDAAKKQKEESQQNKVQNILQKIRNM